MAIPSQPNQLGIGMIARSLTQGRWSRAVVLVYVVLTVTEIPPNAI